MAVQDLLCENAPVARKTFEERFWAKVNKLEGKDACWEWTGGKCKGYGKIMKPYKPGEKPSLYIASRASWIINIGEIPDGLNVLHRCDNPPCIRPSHLFLGDQGVNIRDASSKGRTFAYGFPGSACHLSKLKEADVVKIRFLREAKYSLKAIAKHFNVTAVTIGDIVNRKTWRNVF